MSTLLALALSVARSNPQLALTLLQSLLDLLKADPVLLTKLLDHFTPKAGAES